MWSAYHSHTYFADSCTHESLSPIRVKMGGCTEEVLDHSDCAHVFNPLPKADTNTPPHWTLCVAFNHDRHLCEDALEYVESYLCDDTQATAILLACDNWKTWHTAWPHSQWVWTRCCSVDEVRVDRDSTEPYLFRRGAFSFRNIRVVLSRVTVKIVGYVVIRVSTRSNWIRKMFSRSNTTYPRKEIRDLNTSSNCSCDWLHVRSPPPPPKQINCKRLTTLNVRYFCIARGLDFTSAANPSRLNFSSATQSRNAVSNMSCMTGVM